MREENDGQLPPEFLGPVAEIEQAARRAGLHLQLAAPQVLDLDEEDEDGPVVVEPDAALY